MADDQDKTEAYTFLNKKGTSPFFYAKAAMATKVNFYQKFMSSSRRF